MPTTREVAVRNIRPEDIQHLIKLHLSSAHSESERVVPRTYLRIKSSFPYLSQFSRGWKPKHFERHIEIFPEGQFCAAYGGKLVGAASSLIVNLAPDPYKYHTWNEVTGGKFFRNHNPTGDTVYGASVVVHPKYRRLGIGTQIYHARKLLCKKLNLRRIIAGGRLYNYYEYASEMSAEEYAHKVLGDELSDPSFSFQLRNGFKFIKLLPNYLPDPPSLNFFTFIEWKNPDYMSKESGS